jgi:heptosyltransferase-1
MQHSRERKLGAATFEASRDDTPRTGNLPPVSPRILVVRLSAFGDIVLTTTLLAGIRRTWPDAHIGWLVDRRFASVLEGHEGIDSLHRWDRQAWTDALRKRQIGELVAGIRCLRDSLLQERYELALDAQGLAKSALLARLSGAPVRWSLRPRELAGMISGRSISTRGQRDLIGHEYREMLAAIGCPTPDAMPWMPVTEPAGEVATRLLASEGIESGFVALCPFTTRPQKHWFEARWIELGNAIAKLGRQPVLLGGPQDADAAARMTRSMRALGVGGASSIAGRTSLGHAGAILARASATVGVDTGLTHLSIASGTPTVGLFGSALPYLRVPPPHIVLREPMACSPCDRRPTCNGRFDCMRALSVDRVLASLKSALRAG